MMCSIRFIKVCTKLVLRAVVCCRKHLKQCGLLDKTHLAQRLADDHVAVPVSEQFVRSFPSRSDNHCFKDVEFCFGSMYLRKSQSGHTPRDALLSAVKSLCADNSLWQDELESELPSTWEKHGDMLLLPANCFSSDVWKLFSKSHFVLASLFQ